MHQTSTQKNELWSSHTSHSYNFNAETKENPHINHRPRSKIENFHLKRMAKIVKNKGAFGSAHKNILTYVLIRRAPNIWPQKFHLIIPN